MDLKTAFQVSHRLAVGVDAHGPPGRHLPVAQRLRQVLKLGGLGEVLGKLRGVLLQSTRVYLLQGAAHLLMEADTPWRERLLVQRLAEEGVGEPEADPRSH